MKYFIAYEAVSGLNQSTKNDIIDTPQPISSIGDIRTIEEELKNSNNLDYVTIVSLQPLP
jgi:hypothetical protein